MYFGRSGISSKFNSSLIFIFKLFNASFIIFLSSALAAFNDSVNAFFNFIDFSSNCSHIVNLAFLTAGNATMSNVSR